MPLPLTDSLLPVAEPQHVRLVDRPSRHLASLTGSVDWLTVKVPRVTDRKRRSSVHHLSSTTCCRSEPELLTTTHCRSVPELSTTACCRSEPKLSTTTHCRSVQELLTNTCCCYEPALLTNTCCCYWPVLTSVVGEDDEPRGPRGRATDRWRWHLSSTTATDNSRRRSQRPHCWRAAGRWLWWMVMTTDAY